jgi:hypothetical protein
MAKRKATRKSARKAWHIYRFKERYELPEDLKIFRRSGLAYTRNFVGISGGDEAVGYHNQFRMLCNGDGVERVTYRGLYQELVCEAAQHSYHRRGYLIDSEGIGLTDGQIARMFDIPLARMRKYLRALRRVRLLELVDLPDFDETERQAQADKVTKDGDNKRTKRKKRGRRKAGSGASAENSGNFRNPLKNKNKNKHKDNDSPNGLSATNDNTANAVDKNKNGRRDNSTGERSPTPRQVSPSRLSRTDADASGGERIIPLRASGGSDYLPARSYTRADEQYGVRIYEAMGRPGWPDPVEALRERTSFASKWREIRDLCNHLPPEIVDAIGLRLLAEARRIGRRPANKRPGAVWNNLADKVVNKAIRTG